VFIPATFLTKPEPMEHLDAYFVMTRPIGWWGPVRREAERRGLIEPRPAKATQSRRPLIRRTWTPEEADEWTREDWIAIVLSPLVFAFIMFGLAKLLLLQPSGLTLTLLGVAAGWFIYWVIDPKLRAVSTEYELKQARYLEVLERRLGWEYGDQLGAAASARKER
jgi:hypothetical protein